MATSKAVPPAQIARLAVLGRLGMGTAHAMNNALSAALGETGFLLEDHKDDPEIVEACLAIQVALERCARLSHGLLTHSQHRPSTDDEVDLVRLVRGLERWLEESTGSRRTLSVEAPDDLVLVRGEPANLELVLMVLVCLAAERGESAEVTIRIEAGAPAVMEIEVQACAGSDEAVRWLREPAAAPDPVVASSLSAAREIIAALGGPWQVESDGPESWRVRMELTARG